MKNPPFFDLATRIRGAVSEGNDVSIIEFARNRSLGETTA
jgi:hypothetical protein